LRLIAYFWTGGGQPPHEWLELYLCRDVYHCRPPDLREIPLPTILRHLTCLGVESEVNERRSMKR